MFIGAVLCGSLPDLVESDKLYTVYCATAAAGVVKVAGDSMQLSFAGI